MCPGMVGEGVLGPFDELAVVYEECEELPFRMDDPKELIEPTRGDEVPEE